MPQLFNIYCDESCHLENDGQKAMVLGAVWCPADKRREITIRIREIKRRHGIPSHVEAKWTKVSPAKYEFYIDLVDYFFDDDDLCYRGLIVPNKDLLNHNKFNQDHDTWYYKMYFDMLKVVLSPSEQYRIFIDIKDTLSESKVLKLHDVLCSSKYDFSRNIITLVQQVRSHHIAIMQLTDIITGAISYVNRDIHSSPTKRGIVDRIKHRSGYSLVENTLYRERKVNLLKWRASEVA
ncbi:DUF3800 domain-containing protein [Azospirillum isscasi]|uniref:DUF3800 domain-containing protein n=1 Tax=Azospirillum isscasi TaxID=3053926 RepID=A0ABU0WQC3_9PROT|nr:DUF3800 domain-containing protein [Azospirillum isscasi]MDQ2106439.1 DUF3800 domain-containing protein [Azospirillum isscasi]